MKWNGHCRTKGSVVVITWGTEETENENQELRKERLCDEINKNTCEGRWVLTYELV